METTPSRAGVLPTPPTVGQASYRLLLALAFVWFALDQATKAAIVHLSGFTPGLYPPQDGFVVIPGFFSLVYATNSGAAWGLMQNQSLLLTVIATSALLAIWLFRRKLELHEIRHQFAFGLVCGGICGNLLDRLLHGHVIDFLDFHLGRFRWPTFNFADMGIVVGLGLYALWSIQEDLRAHRQARG